METFLIVQLFVLLPATVFALILVFRELITGEVEDISFPGANVSKVETPAEYWKIVRRNIAISLGGALLVGLALWRLLA